MKRIIISVIFLSAVFLFSNVALAHFGMVIPSDSMVMQGKNKSINLDVSFSHPFERIGMTLEKPASFFAYTTSGKKQNLLSDLKKTQVFGHPAWKAIYKIKRPGIHVFFVEPRPYFEPAEDCYIIHYTKTVVAAFGDDEGWDTEVGLKTEIVPLSKPFALYAGNVFQGIVKLDGKPVSYAMVEVEYYNQDGKAKAPTDYMVTQTIKADQNGVFTYATPYKGWWGFAALNTADYKLKHPSGVKKEVELGAIIWVKFHGWK